MDKRYIRNIPAITEEEQQRLRTKRVLVAGCGGLGGHLIEHMLRLGVGHITAVDHDRFETSNLNRQLLSKVHLIGSPKVDAAAARAGVVNPSVSFYCCRARIDETTAPLLVKGHDVVLDGLDNIKSRKLLFDACSQAGVPFIHGAVGPWNVQCALCLPGSTLLDRLYPEGTVPQGKSTLSFTAALCAAMQSALCTRLLCGREVEGDRLYLYDLLNMEGDLIPFA